MKSVSRNGQNATGHQDQQVARVRIADVQLAKSPCRLRTLAVGSCVAVILYDRLRKIGCLSHSLLPVPERPSDASSPKFATEAIKLMVDLLRKEGSSPEDLDARLVGGASLFGCFQGHDEIAVGARNVEAARNELARQGIQIVAEDVGGEHGRNIEFNTEDGSVVVRSALLGEKRL